MLHRLELRSILDQAVASWELSNDGVFHAAWIDSVFEMLVEYYERSLLLGPVDLGDFRAYACKLVAFYSENFTTPSQRIRLKV